MSTAKKETAFEAASRLFRELKAGLSSWSDDQIVRQLVELTTLVLPIGNQRIDFSDCSPPNVQSALAELFPLMAAHIHDDSLSLDGKTVLFKGEQVTLEDLWQSELSEIVEFDFLDGIVDALSHIPERSSSPVNSHTFEVAMDRIGRLALRILTDRETLTVIPDLQGKEITDNEKPHSVLPHRRQKLVV